MPDEFNDSKKAVVQIGSVQGSHENALTSGTVGRILQAAARMTIDGNPQSAKDWENLRVGTALETGKLKPMDIIGKGSHFIEGERDGVVRGIEVTTFTEAAGISDPRCDGSRDIVIMEVHFMSIEENPGFAGKVFMEVTDAGAIHYTSRTETTANIGEEGNGVLQEELRRLGIPSVIEEGTAVFVYEHMYGDHDLTPYKTETLRRGILDEVHGQKLLFALERFVREKEARQQFDI